MRQKPGLPGGAAVMRIFGGHEALYYAVPAIGVRRQTALAMFEHRKQPLLSRRTFAWRVGRSALVSASLIGASLGVGERSS